MCKIWVIWTRLSAIVDLLSMMGFREFEDEEGLSNSWFNKIESNNTSETRAANGRIRSFLGAGYLISYSIHILIVVTYHQHGNTY